MHRSEQEPAARIRNNTVKQIIVLVLSTKYYKIGTACIIYFNIYFKFSSPCSSLKLWNDVIIAAYGSGHVRLFNAATGRISAEAAAHARWITALDVTPKTGIVSWLFIYVVKSQKIYQVGMINCLLGKRKVVFSSDLLKYTGYVDFILKINSQI